MCAVCVSMKFVKIMLAVCMYVGGFGGLSESVLCVFSKLCPVGFLVVCSHVVC